MSGVKKKIQKAFKPKPLNRRFTELQELQDDRGFTSAQFEQQDKPSKHVCFGSIIHTSCSYTDLKM
jgi:hypothetical protein